MAKDHCTPFGAASPVEYKGFQRMGFWRNNPAVLKQKLHNHRRPAQTARLNPQRTLVSCDDFRHHT